MALSRASRLGFAGSMAVGLVVLGGCTAPDDTSKDEQVASYSNDLRLSSPKLIGSIASGETKSTYYSDPPLYRAYSFVAHAGDTITVDVKSVYGDAVTWITSSGYEVLAMNDDASRSTLDSHVVYTVPASSNAYSFRIVFRDYDRLGATFNVTLKIQSAAPTTCSYGGKTFQSGENFPSTDRCNTCSCGPSGSVACTKRACVCDPENEPYRNYVGTASTCQTIRYTCQTGTHMFSNACGCGCEDDY